MLWSNTFKKQQQHIFGLTKIYINTNIWTYSCKNNRTTNICHTLSEAKGSPDIPPGQLAVTVKTVDTYFRAHLVRWVRHAEAIHYKVDMGKVGGAPVQGV